MNDASLSFSSNIFGFIAGGFSLVGLTVGLCRSHLPSRRIKDLECLLEDTQKTFKCALEDGLLPNARFNHVVQSQLTDLCEDARALHSRVCCATTLLQDYVEFFRGLSTSIGLTCYHVKTLRAQVITTSEAERRKRSESISAPHPTSPIPLSFPVNMIERPRSCPPSLPEYRSRSRLHDSA
ncbi:hypothetical protein BS17DRAFT_696523 [Gyrodon lividus]|nr:hypothetical protein BS17DRAFT_696523 [Gyrodon lividus]